MMSKNKIKKTTAILMLIPIMLISFGCGKSTNDTVSDTTTETIEGDLQDIMGNIYSGLEGLDAETKGAIEGYMCDSLTEENEQAILGTSDIEYTEGVYSVPMMSSVAYQCVLLRVNPDDIETVKQQLKDNADLNKWVCVSAETMLVENVGDLVLFIMSSKDVAYAVSTSFQSLQ